MKALVLSLLGLSFLSGCVAPQVRENIVLEREYPFEIGEPVYLLKPVSFGFREMFSVWMPRQPPPSNMGPPVTLTAIGPIGTTPPVLSQASRESLKAILAELPSYLPKRAIFLVSSQGTVVEVSLLRAREKLNERVFAARLRALTFRPATFAGKAVAVICEIDLVTGEVGAEQGTRADPEASRQKPEIARECLARAMKFHQAHRLEEAEALYRRAGEMDERFRLAIVPLLAEVGKFDEVLSTVGSVTDQTYASPSVIGAVIIANLAKGNATVALGQRDRFEQWVYKSNDRMDRKHYALAVIYMRLGDKDRALREIAKISDREIRQYARSSSEFAGLMNEPDFQSLAK